MPPLRNVDPQEQLDLLFRDVQRARDGVSAGQWEERARQFEVRLHRVIAESVLDDSLHSGSSGKHWSEATGLKLGALSLGLAAMAALAVPPENDLLRSSSDPKRVEAFIASKTIGGAPSGMPLSE